jgi:hypothetical protein
MGTCKDQIEHAWWFAVNGLGTQQKRRWEGNNTSN